MTQFERQFMAALASVAQVGSIQMMSPFRAAIVYHSINIKKGEGGQIVRLPLGGRY